MAARLSSGTIPPFIVPMMGKYMPTHISKRFIPKKDIVLLISRATMAMAIDPTPKTAIPSFSTGTFSTTMLKKEDPVIQHTINVAKINPNGKSSLSPAFLARVFSNGVHMKTKTYMLPSKRDEIIPHKKISRLRMVA